MQVEYVIRKNRKVISTQKVANAGKKTDSQILALAKQALAEKLKSKGKHRVEIRRSGEKAGEWTCVPAKLKKKTA
jgi:BarA-like signal transduction histidine kinase